MSSLDWLANKAVDELAKHAASTCRVDQGTRTKLQAAWANAVFWRCRLGAVTHDSQNLCIDELQRDGTIKSRRYRDSIGRPKNNNNGSQEKLPNYKRESYERWPRYPTYDDEEFQRNLMNAPFALNGPVIRSAANTELELQPERSSPDDVSLEAVDKAFQCIFRSALSEGNRGNRSASAAAKRSRRTTATKPVDPSRQRSATAEARHRKRAHGVHCANIREPPPSDMTAQPTPVDWCKRQRTASQLCEAYRQYASSETQPPASSCSSSSSSSSSSSDQLVRNAAKDGNQTSISRHQFVAQMRADIISKQTPQEKRNVPAQKASNVRKSTPSNSASSAAVLMRNLSKTSQLAVSRLLRGSACRDDNAQPEGAAAAAHH